MPEVYVTNRLRNDGASDADVRLFLTFTAAMDRARDADRLWNASGKMFTNEMWMFQPEEVKGCPKAKVSTLLKSYGVSQRHKADVNAWRTVAGTFVERSLAPMIHQAIFSGRGDAKALLNEVIGQDPNGGPLFPMLRGPKIRVMWIRMLACPGGADISSIAALRVAVDVQVRKITEYLGMTDTIDQDLEDIRDLIQETWAQDVRRHGAEGPPSISNTSAALDPALWFFAKWGCTHCEKERKKIRISDICDHCRFDVLCPGGKVPKRSGKCN